jgi:alginate O-acetyltransferase complex protein AlgI
MNYNQIAFWLLFLAVYLPYRRLGQLGQNRLLLVSSYIFYGFWDYRFLLLILISTVIDFVGGLGVAGKRLSRPALIRLAVLLIGSSLLLTSHIDYGEIGRALRGHGSFVAALPHSYKDFRIAFALTLVTLGYGALLPLLYALPDDKRRKWFLVISMVANLGILFFFKYFDFFIRSFHDLLGAFGIAGGAAPVLGVILPAGISFYTFQAMSYTIDIYRGECEPTDRFADFALFVCFFPHLVAGPIMRAHTLLPQVLRDRSRPRAEAQAQNAEGWLLVLIGLFKKIVISDNMAPIANAVFLRLSSGDTATLTGADVLVGIYAFAFQIYGDFSGYSSIARGISKWLGFELVINFRQPYIAVSPSDFWRRWHISLSTWLRDYLYIPLGGNRKGIRREYVNLTITMLLGGIWHGASWTFVAWGLYHGVILCAFRIAGVRDVKPANGWPRYLLRVVIMFHLTCLGWLLFRADNFPSVTRALALIFGHFHPTEMALAPLCLIAGYCAILFCIELWLEGEERLARLFSSPWVLQGACYTYLLVMLSLFHARQAYEFIYFQF